MAGSKTETVADKLNNLLGETFITQFGEEDISYEVLPTGIMEIDAVLGGGIPIGKLSQFFGREGGGKSSLAMQLVAHTQRNGGLCLWIDIEHGFNPVYARQLGVDVAALLFAEPISAEDALSVVEKACEMGGIDLIVFDSVGSLITNKELAGDITDASVGIRARVLGNSVRRLAGTASATGTTVVFINQLRDVIGAVGAQEKTSTPGGRVFHHQLSVSVGITRTGSVKKGEDIIGQTVQVNSKKNRGSAPMQKAVVDFIYGSGFSNESGVLQAAVDKGILLKSGAWYKWNNEDKEVFAQGAEKARQRLVDEPELLRALLDTLEQA